MSKENASLSFGEGITEVQQRVRSGSCLIYEFGVQSGSLLDVSVVLVQVSSRYLCRPQLSDHVCPSSFYLLKT